jgi:hypothetical protein
MRALAPLTIMSTWSKTLPNILAERWAAAILSDVAVRANAVLYETRDPAVSWVSR